MCAPIASKNGNQVLLELCFDLRCMRIQDPIMACIEISNGKSLKTHLVCGDNFSFLECYS